MTTRTYRALVVDDEPSVQRLLKLALARDGFRCDAASDGNEASELLKQAQYDVVVTDLRMPNKHGHALAIELLERAERPVIVIHTGVLEPRLASDLLARGVDDILFKPVDFKLLAAKVRNLVQRRGPRAPDDAQPAHPIRPDQSPADAVSASASTLAETENKLAGLSAIGPNSKTALDVYSMIGAEDSDAASVAAAIERDASLVAEVLRLANSSLYNPSGKKVTNLETAVLRVGQKGIRELALATAAVAGLRRVPSTI